jgi:hypothetical protein
MFHQHSLLKSLFGLLFVMVCTVPSWAGNIQLTPIGSWGTGYYYDVWVEGTYAYCAAGPTLDILDIQDPTTPRLISSFPIPNATTQVGVVDHWAFVLSDLLHILDVSDPAEPTFTSSCLFIHHPSSFSVAGNLVSVCDSEGIAILDISRPTSPRLLRRILNLYGRTVMAGDRLYVLGEQLAIFDISSPASPKELGTYSPEGYYLADLFIVGRTAYLSGGERGNDPLPGFLEILDMTNPSQPVLQAHYRSDLSSSFEALAIDGTEAYLASKSGLEIVDIGDPASPRSISKLEGKTPYALVVRNHQAVVAAGETGLWCVDVADMIHPSLVGQYDESANLSHVRLRDKYAYLLDNAPHSVSLDIFDISSPAQPVLVGSCPTALDYIDEGAPFEIAGTYGFITDHHTRILVFDLHNPSNPTYLWYLDTPDFTDYRVLGEYVYLATGDGLSVLDLSVPDTGAVAGSLECGFLLKISVRGDYAYALTWDSLLIIDISDPSQPLPLGSVTVGNHESEILLWDSMAILLNDDGDLSMVDVRNPDQPSLQGSIHLPGTIQHMSVSNGWVFTNLGTDRLAVVDVRDPLSPSLQGLYHVPSFSTSLASRDGMVYSAHEWSGKLLVNSFAPLQGIFPHAASTAEWATSLTLANVGEASGEVTVDAVAADGQTLASWMSPTLAPAETVSLDLDDLLPSPVPADLWLRLGGTTPVRGVVAFGTRDGEARTVLPLTSRMSSELVFPYVCVSDTYYTGLTLVNPSGHEAPVSLRAYDEAGALLAETTIALPPGAKYDRLVEQIFTLGQPERIRFVRASSGLPLTGFELFGSFLEPGVAGLEARSVYEPLAAEAEVSPYTLWYPEIRDPASFYTGVTYANLGARPATATASLHGSDGQLLRQADWDSPPSAQVTREIWDLFDGEALPDAAYLKVTSAEPLLGFELYLSSSEGEEGFRFDGSAAACRGARRLDFLLPAGDPAAAFTLHLLNITSTAGQVTIQPYGADGQALDLFTGTLGPGNEWIVPLPQLFPERYGAIAWLRVEGEAELVGRLAYFSDESRWAYTLEGLTP